MSQTPSRRLALRYGAVAALAGLLTPVVAEASPDAALIRLGADLETEWKRQCAYFTANPYPDTDDEINAAIEPCHDLVGRIEQAKARTLAGLQVKALAVAWCCDDMGRGIDGIAQFEPMELFDLKTSNERIGWSIVQDLLRMGRAGA
jgi:hypothetical protein